MEIYAAKGDEKQIELRWWHAFMIFTWLPATLCILIGSLFIWLADALLLDTHHFELSAKPKYKTEVKPKVDMTRETAVMRERGRIRAGIVTIPTFNGHISRASVLQVINGTYERPR